MSAADEAAGSNLIGAGGQMPEGYIQPQMGYKMNYASGTYNQGFKGTMEFGARRFQNERIAERFTPYPGAGTKTEYDVTLQTKRVFHSKKEIRIMSTFITDAVTSLIRMVC